jgi:hypothetical protein
LLELGGKQPQLGEWAAQLAHDAMESASGFIAHSLNADATTTAQTTQASAMPR